MKKLTYLLALLFVFNACKKEGNNLVPQPKKKIASITTFSYVINPENSKELKLSGFETLSFDENELEISKLHYAKDSTLLLKDTFKHQVKKNLVEIKTTTEDGQPISTEKLYYFDGLKKIKQRLRYNQSNELILQDDFTWNKDKKEIHQTRTIQDEIYTILVTRYDSLDNVTSINVENKADNYTEAFIWNYVKIDANNKWLERHKSLNGKVVEIEKREIKYHNLVTL